MDSCSLQSPTLTSIPTSLSRGGLIERPFGYSQLLKLPTSKKYPHARKLRFIDFKAQPSGTVRVHAEAAGATPAEVELRDDDLVFVAGATGRVGSRTVRELLKLGFRVRAGVRSAQRAENLVQSVKQMKLDPENEGTQPVEKLEIVECDLEKPDEIGAALGNASVVICCIGASEKEVFDITGPYRIDYQATKNLVDAATVAKVDHFIMVSSLGTNKVGFPAAILNLFWGVLIWKRQAEKALIASGLNYTIVRPGGMERPTDAYKETHNITLSQEDTLFGGQVSNLQVAELMACMARNRSLSYCKVVEVIAETTAPLSPIEELLAKIPSQRVEPKKPVTTDGPDPPSSKSLIPEESTAPIPNEPAQTKAKVLQPLSPYSAYEDLKPPSSPSPTPSTTPSAPKTSVSAATAVTSVSSLLLDSGATLDKEATQGDVKKMSPLSPYIVYDDLKPPTSPTPTPSGQKNLTIVDGLSTSGTSDTPTSASGLTINITETATQEVPSERPPYVTYDDLKPPTSPTPIPPGQTNLTIVDGLSTSGTSDAQTSAAGVTINITETATEEKPSKRPLSPYFVYEDLKPPTSPSPTPSGPNAIPSSNSVLVESVSPLSGGNDVAKTAITSVTKNPSHNSTYHLSPYHMYEDLKPPTSPIPSPRKS